MPHPDPAAQAFLARRHSFSAKTYTGAVPDAAALNAILTTALRVPDHGKLEPWRLVVIEKAAMKRLAESAAARGKALGLDAEQIEKGRGHFDRGGLAVVVISAPKSVEKIPQVEQLLSAGALCFNLVTTALAAGWGANWLTGWPAHDRAFISDAFGCTPSETVAGIVHIGTPPDTPITDRPRPDPVALTSWLSA